MTGLKNFTDKFKEIPQKSLDLFISLATKQIFKKKEVITKVGENSKYFYIIKSGIVRSFYTDEKGKEYIRTIFTAYKTTGDLGSLLSGKPSELMYDCLTSCIIYRINFKDFIQLTKTNIFISNLYSNMLKYAFLLIESKVYNLSVLNATERYLKLKKEIPDIDNLIPQYHIASYLNVSAVQLSRIRKEIYSK